MRAEDTPDGMKDRISLGTGNWGSYFGTVVVAPNLKGIQNIGLTILRPSEDDKWGNATVDSDDLGRLSRMTKALVKIVGTVQTAPSVGADGQPDGLERNADQLRLEAIIPQFGGDAFLVQQKGGAVIPIPIAVTMKNAAKVGGIDIAPMIGKKDEYQFAWGAQHTVVYTSDDGCPGSA